MFSALCWELIVDTIFLASAVDIRFKEEVFLDRYPGPARKPCFLDYIARQWENICSM